jgi:hypothetical protein
VEAIVAALIDAAWTLGEDDARKEAAQQVADRVGVDRAGALGYALVLAAARARPKLPAMQSAGLWRTAPIRKGRRHSRD